MAPPDKARLQELLQMAVELEFSTIPPYLTAAFSLRPDTNRTCFEIIHSVYMEEMLHMVLAANVLNATGGTVKLDREHVPKYPLKLKFEGQNFKYREFEIGLERFCPHSIQTFMDIELPDHWQELFRVGAVPKLEVPGYTIGEFYGLIDKTLIELCESTSEQEVFNGDPVRQIGTNFYWSGGGSAFEVDGLDAARKAIRVIVEQGEGASSKDIFDGDGSYFARPSEVAHFFRFRQIHFGRKYRSGDAPEAPPTGPEFPVEWGAVYPIKTNCRSSDLVGTPELAVLNTQFNQHFSLMLQRMQEAFTGNPQALYSAIMNDMHSMARIAGKMVQIPIEGDELGQTGAPTFELNPLTR